MLIVLQHIFLEAILDMFYTPVWWYGRGIIYWGKKCVSWLRSGNETLAPGLWLKNLFVPMFGQYDWQGRIISFLIRLVQVIFRGLCLGAWGVVCVLVFIVWIIAPFLIFYEFLSALL